ncbi:MAG: EamA/RhaT family transporter, partial [Ottowia sp.]|nr:EamA/RhaT family transporter [Ottowia sp.]
MTDAAVMAGRQRRAMVLLWIVPALWSSNYIIARLADGVVAPHALAFGRWALALVLMAPFVWRELFTRGLPWHREWKQLLVLGAT